MTSDTNPTVKDEYVRVWNAILTTFVRWPETRVREWADRRTGMRALEAVTAWCLTLLGCSTPALEHFEISVIALGADDLPLPDVRVWLDGRDLKREIATNGPLTYFAKRTKDGPGTMVGPDRQGEGG